MTAVLVMWSVALAVVVVYALNASKFSKSQETALLGLKKLVSPSTSNLADQYSNLYAHGQDPGTDSQDRPKWTVKALFIFPIKSCGGLELKEGQIISSGVCHDREFSFARYRVGKPDARVQKDRVSRWEIMTQRDFPKLVRIKPEIYVPDPKSMDYSAEHSNVKSRGCLAVSFPIASNNLGFGMERARALVNRVRSLFEFVEPSETFYLPLLPAVEQIKSKALQRRPMQIWRDNPEAIDMGGMILPATMERLQAFLGVEEPFTLFRVDPEKPREVFRNAPSKEELQYQPIQSFQDRYPLHINNLASIHDVSSRLPNSFGGLDALRFRSNIYVTGPPSFAEDDWKLIRIGKGTYHVVCRTTRCQLPNVDPSSGTRYPGSGHELSMQPFKLLKTYRAVDEGAREQACLGMQMVPVKPDEVEINVGDEIEVLETGSHYWLD